MSKNLVMVFTRNPELGKVKTRLAKTIGNESALNIYKFLLNHTEITIRGINCDKAVYYSIKVGNNDIWDKTVYQKHQQKGNDLGERMHNAFREAFSKGYKKVVIVGSDLYDLEAKDINYAFEQLSKCDVVIGPAVDGGYYLLGMKIMHSQIFQNKDWGTSTVLNNTLTDLNNKTVKLLDKKNDIDIWEDIKDIPFLISTFITKK
jgi:rSAM/selenodomain-associated transferase 1